MKILAFADTRFPIERANGLQTMATCHALAERGHDVRLVTRPDTHHPARDPFAFYDLAPARGLHVERVPAAGPPSARRAHFLVTSLALAGASGADLVFTRDLGVAAFLLQVPVPRRPPLVYESHGIAAVVAGEMPTLLGKPELAPSDGKLRRLDRRDERVWRRAAAYVTITRALADDLTARFGARAGVFVVPDGAREMTSEVIFPRIGTPLAGPDSGKNDLRGHFTAAYSGHLYPWKGVDVFVRAVASVPGMRGLIVGGHAGEGDLARVTALIAELGAGDRITVTGHVPPGEVARRLAAASVLVLPNSRSAISERFTSPLKLFEYLAMAKPIVASDTASIREVLTDGQTALLVAPDDAGALAAALGRVMQDAALAAALGAAAGALAPHYTWERRAERLEEAFRAAVAP